MNKASCEVNQVSSAKVCLLIFLTSTAVITSFASIGYNPGSDVNIHLSFWFATARQWREGIPLARWAGQSLFGYGDPGLLFYPPLSRILGGALMVCLPPRWALGAYAWLVLAMGGFSFFHLCREFFDDRSSLFAAFSYIINPYNLLLLYVRWALAEFLAAAMFPWFILALYRLGKGRRRSVAVLALLVGLIWLTNVPAGVIANYAAAVFIAVVALARRSKSLPTLFLLAEVLGAGLGACYLLPAWRMQPWIDMSAIFAYHPLQNFLLVGKWYRSSLHFWVFLNASFLWQAMVGGVACLAAWKMCPRQRATLLPLTIILAVSAFLCIPVSAILWNHGPFLSYIQFPWRWLFPLSLAVSFFTSAALSGTSRHSWLALAACLPSLILFLPWSAVRSRVLDWDEIAAPFKSGAGILLYTDYRPRAVGEFPDWSRPPAWMPSPPVEFVDRTGTDREASGPGAMPSEPAEPATITIQSWRTESRIFKVDTPQPARVRLRLFYFPGWHVLVNGSELREIERDAHDAIVVPVPARHARVEVEFKHTPEEIAGMIISGIVAIVVAALYFARAADSFSLRARITQP